MKLSCLIIIWIFLSKTFAARLNIPEKPKVFISEDGKFLVKEDQQHPEAWVSGYKLINGNYQRIGVIPSTSPIDECLHSVIFAENGKVALIAASETAPVRVIEFQATELVLIKTWGIEDLEKLSQVRQFASAEGYWFWRFGEVEVRNAHTFLISNGKLPTYLQVPNYYRSFPRLILDTKKMVITAEGNAEPYTEP